MKTTNSSNQNITLGSLLQENKFVQLLEIILLFITAFIIIGIAKPLVGKNPLVRQSIIWVAMGLLGLEVIVFAGCGLKCPLTALAVRYGAQSGHVFDTFLPERMTRYTFRFFGSVMVIGLLLMVGRWLGVLR